jgi:hypothetical protein
MAYGFGPKLATELVKVECTTSLGSIQERAGMRNIVPHAPEDLSVSYREVCLRDYRHNTCFQAPQPPHPRASLRCASCLVGTLDAIDAETKLLATNMVALDYHLNQFYIDLFLEWGLMESLEEHAVQAMQGGKNIKDNNKEWWIYSSMGHAFGKEILYPLDCGDEIVVARCAKFMAEYFNNIPPDSYMWFTPKCEE